MCMRGTPMAPCPARGIPAASLVGSDQEETVAKLKGTLIAIDESQSGNGC